MERDGVDGLTIRALSAQADVSPTSIYQHIGGKQAVCDALIDTYFTDLREQLIAIDESDPPDSTCKCNGWFRVGLF